MLLEEPAFRTTVLRLPAVYGPRDYQLRVWEYLRKMDSQRKAIIASESLSKWQWSRGYVENIAAAVSHVLNYEPAPRGIFNLSDPTVLTEKEWIQQIAQTAGWDGSITTISDDRLLAPLKLPYNFAQNWSVDAGRFRSTTGFSEPFTLQEALWRTVEWHRANPPELSQEQLEGCREQDEAEDLILSKA